MCSKLLFSSSKKISILNTFSWSYWYLFSHLEMSCAHAFVAARVEDQGWQSLRHCRQFPYLSICWNHGIIPSIPISITLKFPKRRPSPTSVAFPSQLESSALASRGAPTQPHSLVEPFATRPTKAPRPPLPLGCSGSWEIDPTPAPPWLTWSPPCAPQVQEYLAFWPRFRSLDAASDSEGASLKLRHPFGTSSGVYWLIKLKQKWV